MCLFIKHQGFSLLELMIVMAISAILVCIAYPVYASYQASGYRQRAEVILIQLAARLADYYAENNSYQGADIKLLTRTVEKEKFAYSFQLAEVTNDHFMLQAIPDHNQQMLDAQCGILSFTDRNERSASGSGGVAQCWT